MINAINKGLKKGDARFYDLVSVEFLTSDSKWIEKIRNNFENFQEKDLNPYKYDEDTESPGIIFWTKLPIVFAF